MIQLPVELQRLCIEALRNECDTLKALRSTNKHFNIIATEVLFRKAVLNHTDDSAERYFKLAHSPLSHTVRHLVLNTSEDPELSTDYQPEAEIKESFASAISMISGFEKLEEVEVRWSETCVAPNSWTEKYVAETSDYRNSVFRRILASLRRAHLLNCLTIKNLQDYQDDEVFESEDFVAVRQCLTRLHLQIASEYEKASPASTIQMPALHEGFTIDLPRFWLKPLANQLTHLSLYAEQLWGVWPLVDFRLIPTFTRLKSLSFGSWTLAHDWQIDWIVSHATTLEQLLLDDCPVVTILEIMKEEANANFPEVRLEEEELCLVHVSLRWHTILDRFRTGLSNLQHFVLRSGYWDKGEGFDGRYQLLNRISAARYTEYETGCGPSPWDQNPSTENDDDEYRRDRQFYGSDERAHDHDCDEKDKIALFQLLQAVDARANNTSGY